MSNLIAVVNHLGERMLITPEHYRRGHWQLWQDPTEIDTTEDPLFPLFVGAGWWRLSNGNSVRGEVEARRQQALLEER
jgi:hypothetical protein